MIDYHLFCEIKRLSEQDKLTPPQIANSLELNIKTVRTWLAKDTFEPRRSRPGESILDPYKGLICQLLERYPYSAAQIFRMLQERDYTGGLSTVRSYVSKVRPSKKKAYLSLAFAPGEAAQVDWGHAGTIRIGNTTRRLSFFVMVLSYSRMIYVEFTLRQSMEHFLECHRNAFEFFGGIPAKVIVDNCKTAVLSNRRGYEPVFNPAYMDFARHYGFEIKACNVRSPHEKGQVENGVSYVRKSLLNGLLLSSPEAVNLEGARWRDEIANRRIHGSTGQSPVDLFEKEKAILTSLPVIPYDCGVSSRARSNSQFRVHFDSNRYSVPAHYASMTHLTLRAYSDRLCIYFENNLIAEHKRSYEHKMDIENPDHARPLLKHKLHARQQKQMQRFLSWGELAENYLHGLQEHRCNTIYHIRQILTLAEIHGEDSVQEVMADACHYRAFSSDYVANLLEQRARRKPTHQHPLHLSRNQDLLDLEIQTPDMSIYDCITENQPKE